MNRQILPAILCVVATVCNATTYYVSTTGNDENDGLSLGTAFSSLAKAVDAAGAEEAEILIAPGTYEQSAAIRVEAPLSIRGTGAAAADLPGAKARALDALKEEIDGEILSYEFEEQDGRIVLRAHCLENIALTKEKENP